MNSASLMKPWPGSRAQSQRGVEQPAPVGFARTGAGNAVFTPAGNGARAGLAAAAGDGAAFLGAEGGKKRLVGARGGTAQPAGATGATREEIENRQPRYTLPERGAYGKAGGARGSANCQPQTG